MGGAVGFITGLLTWVISIGWLAWLVTVNGAFGSGDETGFGLLSGFWILSNFWTGDDAVVSNLIHFPSQQSN